MIDWDRPIENYSGQPAKLIYELRDARRPMVVVIDHGTLGEEVNDYKRDTDLIRNRPEKFYVNIYRFDDGRLYAGDVRSEPYAGVEYEKHLLVARVPFELSQEVSDGC